MSLHAIGITAEYNPFHNGHRWQLQTLREKSGNVPVIACMSGWVVQLGEMAAADPWIRASMAVLAGVDLVVLLPAWYTLRSADYFAAGAVKTGIPGVMGMPVLILNERESVICLYPIWFIKCLRPLLLMV